MVSGLDDQIEDEIAHREVGRAETENFTARYLFEPVLRPAELVLDLIGGQLVQVPMEIRMTGDLVSVVHDPPHDRGVAFRDPPKDEERRSGLGGCEDIQELVNVRFEPRLQPIPIMRGEARPDVLGVEPVLDVEGRTEPLLLDRGNSCVIQPHLHPSSFPSSRPVLQARPRGVCSGARFHGKPIGAFVRCHRCTPPHRVRKGHPLEERREPGQRRCQSGSFAHDPVEAPAIRNALQLVFAPSLELEPAAGDEILDGLRDEHRVLLPSPPARQCSTNEAVVPFNELLPSGLGDLHRLILGPQIPRATGPSSPVAGSQP